MRQALIDENKDLWTENHKYIMRITGDNAEGKEQLDNFIDEDSTYPVIAVTSKLMTTGVDAKMCKPSLSKMARLRKKSHCRRLLKMKFLLRFLVVGNG